jgi:peptidyl-prolyl cis-trans isomerase D
MISWIQNSFQKHFRAMFAVLLGVVIISFVFTIGAAPGIGQAGHKVLEQDFFGHNLGNEQDARAIFRDGNLSAQLKGAFQATGPQLQQYSLSRIAGLALAKDLGIPQPTDQELSAYIANLPVFKNEQGNFDQTRYKNFEDSLKTGRDFTAADATRIFREDARLEALSKVLAGPGYVLPGEIADQLKRSDTTWTVAVGSLDYAAFDAGVSVNDVALQKFFDENSFRYEVPARPKLSVVEFKTAEFMPATGPSEAEARAYFQANAARFPAPADAKKDASLSLDKAAPAAADHFPQVRAQVEAAMKEDVARRAASRAANDFTVGLYERKVAANSADLTAFVGAQRRTATQLAPFTFDAPPSDRPWLANYAEQINRLNKDRFFSDPLPAPDGYIVLLWNDTLAAYKPMLTEVREKVAADYREAEKRKRFADHGKAVRERLQAAVKAGRSFEDAAKAEKLDVKSYANFTLRQPPQDLPYAAFSAMQNLEAGQVSDMVTTGDKGHFAFAAEKKLPDVSANNPRYAEVRKQLMEYTAAANESALLSSLVEEELKRNAPATPAATP